MSVVFLVKMYDNIMFSRYIISNNSRLNKTSDGGLRASLRHGGVAAGLYQRG